MLNFRHYLESESYRDQVTSGELGDISVGKLYDFAKTVPEYLQTVPVKDLVHDLSWWNGDKERMQKADTSFPIIVLKLPNGHLTVADGLNRLKKSEHRKNIKAYVIPSSDLPKSVFI